MHTWQLLILIALVVSPVSTGKLTEAENEDRLDKCGTGGFTEYTMKTEMHMMEARLVAISPRHVVLSAGRMTGWNGQFSDKLATDCKDRMMKIDKRIKLSDGTGDHVEVTYIGDCDPSKQPSGIVVAEMAYTQNPSSDKPPSDKTQFACLSDAKPSKRNDVFASHSDTPVEIKDCPTSGFCIDETGDNDFDWVHEKVDDRWNLVGVNNLRQDDPEIVTVNFISDHLEEICKVSGICPRKPKVATTIGSGSPTGAPTGAPPQTVNPSTFTPQPVRTIPPDAPNNIPEDAPEPRSEKASKSSNNYPYYDDVETVISASPSFLPLPLLIVVTFLM